MYVVLMVDQVLRLLLLLDGGGIYRVGGLLVVHGIRAGQVVVVGVLVVHGELLVLLLMRLEVVDHGDALKTNTKKCSEICKSSYSTFS